VTQVAWQPFAEFIERRDLAGAVAAIEALDEPGRKRLGKLAKPEVEELENEGRWPQPGTARWQERRDRLDVAEAIRFGTGGAAAAVRGRWYPWEGEDDLRERLVRCRPRVWRQDWAERTLADPEWRHWDWPVVHRMVKDGLIDRPDEPGYVAGAAMGIRDIPRRQRAGSVRPLADVLRGEQEWLRTDLWQLFAIEDSGLTAQGGGGGHQSWLEALCELEADGTVPRERLLDETLGALRRDFTPHNSRFFHKLYDALEPTVDEHAARLDDLLALLASEDPAVVGFALRPLGQLERAKRLPPDRVAEAIGPALLLPVKGHAARAAKLLGRLVKREPGAAAVALPVLADALAHEAREVQEAALDALERHREVLAVGDAARLAEFAEAVDPALRPRVAALAGAEAAVTVTVEAGPAVPVPGRRAVVPRLEDAEPLAPVADVDELLDRMAVALERGDDPDEIELLLDGVSRLRGSPVDPARARALVERALDVAPSWRGAIGLDHARDALSAVILRCLGGHKLTLARTGRSPREALAQRLRELLADLPGRTPRPLLSAPTHRGGWIDPAEAVRRVAGLDSCPGTLDLAQMVLRLAPDGRDEARAAAEGVKGEPAAVLVLALGGKAKRPLLARHRHAWTAAGQARDPAAFRLPAHDLNEGAGHRFWTLKADKVAAASPADLLTLENAWWGWEEGGLEGWLATVWPANREPVYQLVVRRLWLNRGTREYGIGDVLELLLGPSEPVGEQAALAIALALGNSDVATRTLAADVTILALGTRRLDGPALGAQLARLLREHEHAVPSRWAASLDDVAAAGPLAAHDVQAAVEAVLAAATDDDRRRLLGLVDLLRRLAAEADAAVSDPAARAWLEALPPRSKGGRAAREMLEVTGRGAARSRAAAAEAAAAQP
jgi:hypothetical protein